MRFDCVCLDFDGTLTLAEEGGARYVEEYREDLSRRLERDLTGEWQRAEASVREDPTLHGLLYQGKVVAPGNADPFIRSSTVARMVMDEFGSFPESAERERVLGELYAAAYDHTTTVFRGDARPVLERLSETGLPVFVVTNSRTDSVERKIAGLLGAAARPPAVFGDAKKAILEEPEPPDARFDALPATRALPGLPRPVYLRRGRYYEALRAIWQRARTEPARTLLVGDIYELDLAMPLELGVSVHLLEGQVTSAHERHFVADHPRGSVSSSLGAVLERLGVPA